MRACIPDEKHSLSQSEFPMRKEWHPDHTVILSQENGNVTPCKNDWLIISHESLR